MRLRQITFTGVDAGTDIRKLMEIQKDFPIVEFGVLASYHWKENGNRYLDPSLFESLVGLEHLSLHLCGTAAVDAARGNWSRIYEYTRGFLPIFDRIQLNLSRSRNAPDYVAVPILGRQEVIIQQRDAESRTLYDNTIRQWPGVDNFSMLLDASGGKGVDTQVVVFPSERKIGYAGGISPDNVGAKLAYLLRNVQSGTFWIDMETGVRTGDWFDVDKVRQVLSVCSEEIYEFELNNHLND